MSMNVPGIPDVRGYLLHISHYDPSWCAVKDKEKPFDLQVGLEVVDVMAEAGFNLLVMDPKDGVAYGSHPELKRHYTQPMDVLGRLAGHARERGLDVAVKLNFSQSGTHRHNHWFAPHNGLFDNDEYWQRAFRIIDELIEAARPKRFFHVGMDEDHDRSVPQYVEAIRTLHEGLSRRHIRTLIWNDSACHWPQAAVHRDKSLAAEKHAPKDVTHVIWDYGDTIDIDAFRRAIGRGLTVWGAPGSRPGNVEAMLGVLAECGAEGILLTRWIPCIPENRDTLIGRVKSASKLFGR